jgi:UDP-N-acetylglucosamine diphosphorylase/glucosamine-1-phosphate N-acetyltransferase
MQHYILFDDSAWGNLLPLTFTRPVCEIRIGILTIREKWQKYLETECSFLTQDYLSEKYPLHTGSGNIYINGSVLPTSELVNALKNLLPGECMKKDSILIAYNLDHPQKEIPYDLSAFTSIIEFPESLLKIDYPWQIFSNNGVAITQDFELLTKGRKSAPLSNTNRIAGEENIFLEEGAKVEFSIINATTGPVYIGKDAEIMEGCLVRGPFALCEHSALKMGAKIYGPTTIGPYSKVGGEVNNSVLFAYSNKAHDGFLGNSVLGEWCNLGADTNNSNLKNNYEKVKLWSYVEERFISTGLQFCGLIMGDHSKSGINTMFNTGTVVGVSANIFGDGFPRNFIPSFSWGGAQGYMVYKPEKAFKTAELVYDRRGMVLSESEKGILAKIFEKDEKYRRF